MDLKFNISCVIVTYNRKQLLKRCLEAVVLQEYKPSNVYIIDNASTDGTIESVKEWGFYNCIRDEIKFNYVLNEINEGGAGGFHLGMKYANKDANYDGFWVMDDDGEPHPNCLLELCKHLDVYDYISPLVLDDTKSNRCSFYNKTSTEMISIAKNGIIRNLANPFNGILYSKKLIDTIGYPKRELFIWGDEVNYDIRAKKRGFHPITAVNAIHYHPLDRQEKVKIITGDILTDTKIRWKLYCLIRNNFYNFKIRFSILKSVVIIIKYYFIYIYIYIIMFL